MMSANLLFSRQPGNANNDVVAIALLLASVAILVNARSTSARGPLLVAGLAAGPRARDQAHDRARRSAP